jgi:hypothetical protein
MYQNISLGWFQLERLVIAALNQTQSNPSTCSPTSFRQKRPQLHLQTCNHRLRLRPRPLTQSKPIPTRPTMTEASRGIRLSRIHPHPMRRN